jgi:drug/metabolite transporter (DMT)-like permease
MGSDHQNITAVVQQGVRCVYAADSLCLAADLSRPRGAQLTLLAACALGLTINHSTFVCTRFNDPLTTSVAGSVKNIAMTFIGAVAFGDFRFAPWNALGLGMSMAGAIWYATKSAIKVRPRAHFVRKPSPVFPSRKAPAMP